MSAEDLSPSRAGGAEPGAVRYRIRLKPGREKSVLLRHPWIFTGACREIEALAGAEPGDVGDVVDSRGTFLARGTVQPESQIVARLLAWEPRPIDGAFFHERIRRAAAAREFDTKVTNAWRVVNAEGDELPGLIVDRYADVLAVQTLTSGMRRLQGLWLDALEEILHPRAIIERGERARRESVPSEGPAFVLRGARPEGWTEILENSLRFLVDVQGGQKTGFYLDQRENRAGVLRRAGGREVLNLFGYTGAFSVYAAAGGARRVVQVESSSAARDLTRRNWERNHLAPELLTLSGEDVFQFLRHERGSYDLLVLDPPPFAKDRGSLERALRAYKDLNLWAFCRAREGALIWSFSCSQHVSAELFQKVVFGAARDAGASVQWLARLGAGFDHPVHLDHPQGEYLKGLCLRVLRQGAPPSPRRSAASSGVGVDATATAAEGTAENVGEGENRREAQ